MPVKAHLLRGGHRVTTAQEGEDALAQFQPGGYDIVMPRKEGIETLLALRQLAHHRDVRGRRP